MLKVNTRDWLSFIEHQFVNGACPPVHLTEMLKVNTGDWLSFTVAPARERSLSPCSRATLRRISLEDLSALVNQPLSEECQCIDIDTSDIRKMTVHTDESVRQEILCLSQCQSIAEFQRKDIGERKEICRIMKERGAGVRQLSRITGISLGTISKC